MANPHTPIPEDELHTLLVNYQDEMFSIRSTFLSGGDREQYLTNTSRVTNEYEQQHASLIDRTVAEARNNTLDEVERNIDALLLHYTVYLNQPVGAKRAKFAEELKGLISRLRAATQQKEEDKE